MFRLIFTIPATLKITEKPRKYHFNLSQSTFTLRNNSTGSFPSWGRSAYAPAFFCFPAEASETPITQLSYSGLD
jgi:hypothetical protein